jgi:hypothetical protein
MKNFQTISTDEATVRLNEAGVPVTASTIRRWCAEEGFAVRIGGRWRIPERNVVEVERKLIAANDDGLVLPCRASKR